MRCNISNLFLGSLFSFLVFYHNNWCLYTHIWTYPTSNTCPSQWGIHTRTHTHPFRPWQGTLTTCTATALRPTIGRRSPPQASPPLNALAWALRRRPTACSTSSGAGAGAQVRIYIYIYLMIFKSIFEFILQPRKSNTPASQNLQISSAANKLEFNGYKTHRQLVVHFTYIRDPSLFSSSAYRSCFLYVFLLLQLQISQNHASIDS